jgi:hypothetical protein
VYGEATLKAIFKLDTAELEKILAKDIKKVLLSCTIIGAIISAPFLLIATMLFMVVGTVISPVDMSELEVKNFGETVNPGELPGNCYPGEDPWPHGQGNLGWYYAQCDIQWADVLIGPSPYNIGYTGCLVSSMAMIFNAFGHDIRPDDVAAIDAHFLTTADMTTNNPHKWSQALGVPDIIEWTYTEEAKNGGIPNIGGPITNVDINAMKNWFNQNEGGLMVVGVCCTQHWVVLAGMTDDGSDFILYDPWSGPDQRFLSVYQTAGYTIIRAMGYWVP